MGPTRDIKRELTDFRSTVNGFIIKYYGIIGEDSSNIKFKAEISRPGPMSQIIGELEEPILALLIYETIEWTYTFKIGKNENNERISRYGKSTLFVNR